MSDEVFPTPTRQIDIPARFIRQATEHIDHTGSRYVTFLFTGEQVMDAICVGVTTRLLITDQRPTAQPVRPVGPIPAGPWTIATLTNEVILSQVQEHGQINVRRIGDNLGIAGSNISLRQRIRRVLAALTAAGAIHKIASDGTVPDYAVTGETPTMPLRTRRRRITRKDITEERVLGIIQKNGRTSSRIIGDIMNIPRGDASVRGKISTVIQDLTKAGRVRITEGTADGGGRLYEMASETVAEA